MQLTSRLEKALITSAILLCGIVGTYFIENQYAVKQNQLKTIRLSDAQNKVAEVSAELSLSLQKKIYSAYTLANIISTQPSITNQQLQKISQSLLNHDSQLMAVGVAIDDIITYVYPELLYAPTIGLDTTSSPTVKNQIQKLKSHPKTWAQGTIHKVEDAPELYILRSPIFTGDIGSRSYLGHILLLINIQKVVEDSHLLDTVYSIAVRQKEAPTQVFGDLQAMKKPLLVNDVEINYGDWEVFIAEKPDANPAFWYLINPVRWYGYLILSIILAMFAIISMLYLQARQRSMQDELTGLPNRRYFIYTLKNIIGNAKHSGTRFALLNIDLDGFKQINDNYGHASGDLILKQVAKRLRKSVRANDTIARVGGDEFLIIVSRIKNEDELAQLVQSIQSRVEQGQYLVQGAFVNIKVSIGYSLYHNQSITFDHLLSEADINMYKNKALKRQLKGLRRAEIETINALDKNSNH
ncbi:GGDEF domain-containing protein [Vibrio breoganii]